MAAEPQLCPAAPMSPLLKWPGGKRWFVHSCADLLPERYERYIEPFLGGASVFFRLVPKRAILGDVNPDVLAVYRAIKRDWKGVEALLQHYQSMHSDDYYYKIRNERPEGLIERAARVIYLNRTCFNGIYRVNLAGEFNVPRGTKMDVLLDTDCFEAMAFLLSNAQLRLSDFEALIDEAAKGDFIFADPPYTVRHNYNGFIKYNEKLFSWEDQERLADALVRAVGRGAKVVATNADHESVRQLYRNTGLTTCQVSRFSAISANAKSRKQFSELIIRSGQPDTRRRSAKT